MSKLSVTVAGIHLTNPVMPAAGPSAKDGAMCQAAAAGGAGAIVTKTISTEPAEVPRPCMAEIKGGFLNTELWSELPKEQWLETEYQLAKATGLPLIIGLGYTAEQIRELAPLVKPYADALELSTHYIGKDLTPIIEALKAAKAAVDVPVFMKVSPHANIREISLVLEAAGADGLVMINSFGPCMSIDLDSGLPLMGSKSGYGWLSGTAIKPLAVRCIYDAASVVNIPIIGVGGVASGRDAAEMFMAGASAVQVCTEAILKGPAIYGKIARELEQFLDERGYTSLEDIQGLAIRNMRNREAVFSPVVPEVDQESCKRCGRCEVSCVYGAITRAEQLRIDPAKCFGCSLCVSRCPFGALRTTAAAASTVGAEARHDD